MTPIEKMKIHGLQIRLLCFVNFHDYMCHLVVLNGVVCILSASLPYELLEIFLANTKVGFVNLVLFLSLSYPLCHSVVVISVQEVQLSDLRGGF